MAFKNPYRTIQPRCSRDMLVVACSPKRAISRRDKLTRRIHQTIFHLKPRPPLLIVTHNAVIL